MSEKLQTNNNQTQAFAKRQRKRFEDELLVFLREEYGYSLARKDDEWIRDLIRTGISESSGYGIELEADVARYIELMLALSPDFDSSKQFPYAAEALASDDQTAERRLDRIYENILFAADDGAAPVNRTGKAPHPFCRQAAQQAEQRFRSAHPKVAQRPLTMKTADDALRQRWMQGYHQVLDEMGQASPTSRPYSVVGDSVADQSRPPTGSLRIHLVDEQRIEPADSASVQVQGPETFMGVTDDDGLLELSDLPVGMYEILAVDQAYRVAKGSAQVARGLNEITLRCLEAQTRQSA